MSAEISESDVDLKLVNGEPSAAAGDVPHANALVKFAEAVASRDEQALAGAREHLLGEAGPEVLVEAAAVAGNFQRMVRIADSTGIPLDDRSAAISYDIRDELELDRFESARHTPRGGLRVRLMSLIARPMAKRMFKKMAQ